MQDKNTFNAKDILNNLKEFEKNLINYLKLENDIFYVKLLEKMNEHKMNTEETKKFIAKMDNIKKIMLPFLQKYKKTEIIKNTKKEFTEELTEIKKQLILRTESEEEDIYMYWDALV